MPIAWVDGVTDVNAANMEIIDTDIAARQVTAEKGAANGYAPLDAGAKVPLVNLPPVSGVDYIGTWGSGIAYKKGDVVRYGTQDYMAVNDSTGVTPPAVAVLPFVPVSYAITLPASPFDGQEAILVDSLTNPSYQWRFRYNAGSSSAYKWEFIGGAPQGTAVGINSYQDTSSAAYVAHAAMPTITVSRTGEYLVRYGAGLQALTAVVNTIRCSPYYNSAANAIGEIQFVPTGQYDLSTQTHVLQRAVLTAGWVLGMAFSTDNVAQSARCLGPWLELTPRRVA